MSAATGDLSRAVTMLRTLANPTRLRIVLHLLQGEAAVSQIEQALELRQPNLSQQLAELRDAGVVTARREAKSVIYALEGAEVPALAAMLQRLFVAGSAAPPTGAAAGLSGGGGNGVGATAAGPEARARPPASNRPRQAAAFAIVGDVR